MENSIKLKASDFICPHCNVHSQHKWKTLKFEEDIKDADFNNSLFENSGFSICNRHIEEDEYTIYISRCTRCGSKTIWVNREMIYPQLKAPIPNKDMPQSVLEVYREAEAIYTKSPRSACALLRLAIEKLCTELNAQGNNLNDKIRYLVSNGLPAKIQQALDSIRVIGNKAIHAGQISVDVESCETAYALFEIINIIIEKMVSESIKIDNIFSALPESVKNDINIKDKNSDL